MPEIQYVDKRWAKKTMAIVASARAILEEYVADGYSLTLRQLYYQFIARDMLPDSWVDAAYNAKNRLPATTKNTEKNYKRLGNIISNARLAGLIDWDWIVDRTRFLRGIGTFEDIPDSLDGCAEGHRLDHWAGQDERVEVWVEKDALIGVLERPANKWRVDYFACKGNVSQSALWGAAQRMTQRVTETGQHTLVLHLADHDPTGWDMTRDIADRLKTFDCADFVEVRRIALNMDQVRKYKPPPNPTKWTDSRAKRYVLETGAKDSWELDALTPQQIAELIQKHVKSVLYRKDFDEIAEREERERDLLHKTSGAWDKVRKLLSGEAQARIGAAALKLGAEAIGGSMDCGDVFKMLVAMRKDLLAEADRIQDEEADDE